MGRKTIEIVDKYPVISEILCSGCGLCAKKCPFEAISIVNLSNELKSDCVHRFGPNSFKLFRLPIVKRGAVLGLVGQNSTGKTTALRILAGQLKPNLCNYQEPPNWSAILNFFRGSELQSYFQRLREGGKVALKPQYITLIPKVFKGTVKEALKKADQRGVKEKIIKDFGLEKILNRKVEVLSGGELQKLAIASVFLKNVDDYLLDEPSSFLDVKERFQMAKKIRELAKEGKSVVVVEHDLSILDYMSDYISIFYGEPSVYGIVSHVHPVRTGLNIYLNGYIPDENVRFRKESVVFSKKATPREEFLGRDIITSYTELRKKLGSFDLTIKPGEIRQGEVIGIIGPNGIGKTTFMKILAGLIEVDRGEITEKLKVSYKPQYLKADYKGTVEDFLKETLRERCSSSLFKNQIADPLGLTKLYDMHLQELSGGELQKVALASALFRKADIMLLYEPSSYLDSEIRLKLPQLIRIIVETNMS